MWLANVSVAACKVEHFSTSWRGQRSRRGTDGPTMHFESAPCRVNEIRQRVGSVNAAWCNNNGAWGRMRERVFQQIWNGASRGEVWNLALCENGNLWTQHCSAAHVLCTRFHEKHKPCCMMKIMGDRATGPTGQPLVDRQQFVMAIGTACKLQLQDKQDWD